MRGVAGHDEAVRAAHWGPLAGHDPVDRQHAAAGQAGRGEQHPRRPTVLLGDCESGDHQRFPTLCRHACRRSDSDTTVVMARANGAPSSITLTPTSLVTLTG